jgi:hypothetical protein
MKKKASIKTGLISSKISTGQCLFFNLNIINLSSKFEVVQINSDGTSRVLFNINNQNISFNENHWTPVYVSLRPINDFFIEFNAITAYNDDSIIALDDISLHTIEHCQSKRKNIKIFMNLKLDFEFVDEKFIFNIK